jgi:multimeric flavodoxin WrbA
MQILHEKMVEADGFIIGAPVYMVSVPGQLKTFVDRCRTFAHDFRLIGKVLGAVTVGYFRHAGEENTVHTINNFGYTMFMNVVAEGASTISTKEGTGVPIKDPKIAVKEDRYGLYWVRQMGIRVGHMAKIVKAGREITGLV